MTNIILIAKEPVAGNVKTRLTPDLSPEDAAKFAARSLNKTITTVNTFPSVNKILLYTGTRLPKLAEDDWTLLPQVEGSLDERIATAFDTVEGKTLLVGMDTPQLQEEDLDLFFNHTETAEPHVWLGLASDGGWWGLGMSHPNGSLIRGVKPSTEHTGYEQLLRFQNEGVPVTLLPVLTDIDTYEDVLIVPEALDIIQQLT